MPQENKTAAPAKAGSQQPVTQSVTFRDSAFKSRTIVFADGSTVPVISSLITVSTSERIEHLTQLGDFDRTDSESTVPGA
jgi:hypothetical protein